MLKRVDAIGEVIENSETLPKKESLQMVEKTKAHLLKNFASGAPFTVYRLAEILLEKEVVGRHAMQRYLHGLLRVVMVLSKETDYKTEEARAENGKPSDGLTATDEDYVSNDLPTNVRYVKLPWVSDTETKVSDFDVEESINAMDSHALNHARTPPLKRHKTEEERPAGLLSPLQMSKNNPAEAEQIR